MIYEKKISDAVIKRLPRYYRYLTELKQNEIVRISSRELSEKMTLTASQIRQDLSCFGGFGQQGYGYNVESLQKEIGKILGIDKHFNLIIIGAGNMGQALANYPNFEKRGYVVIGVFDIDPNLIGKKIKELTIKDIKTVDKFIKNNSVDIVALTIPSAHTKEYATKMIDLGIKGLWNFSAIDIDVDPEKTIVENVHLSDSLMVLGYKINNNIRGG